MAAISLAGILTLLLGVWLTHRLARDREREKLRSEARTKFRAAVSPLLQTLREHSVDTHFAVGESKTKVDLAISEFENTLNPKETVRFQAAVVQYREATAKVKPGILTFYESEATGNSAASEVDEEVAAALDALVAFAR